MVDVAPSSVRGSAPPESRREARRDAADWGVLLALFVVAAVANVTKAVHIDDTAYLEIAQAISKSPTHSMSVLLNWGDTAEPIHTINQPHLLFYVMAGVMRALPNHFELFLHVLWVLFSAAAILLFDTLARILGICRPRTWTALFALGPALLPSQNLMVDVPLVALWLGVFVALARADAAGDDRVSGYFLIAASLTGVACLVKYTSLVLLPVLGLSMLARPRGRPWWVLLVPLGLIAAWSLFNWNDYGGVHLLERALARGTQGGTLHRIGVSVSRAVLWIEALGAIAPFTVAFLPALARRRAGRALLGITLLVAAVSIAAGRRALESEPAIQSVLRGLFLGNGLLMLGIAGMAGGERSLAGRRLVWWASITAVFVVFLPPFIAVRHVFLSLTALTLVIARGSDSAQLSARAMTVGLAVTGLLGMALASSDLRLAEVYRQAAPRLAARYCPAGTRCVAVGHWGWQWYAKRAGMTIYDRETTKLAPGDRVIIPELVAKQTLREVDAARLRLVSELEVPANASTMLRTMATEHSAAQGNRAGGFYYFWTSIPWTLTTRPLDRFGIYEVDGPATR